MTNTAYQQDPLGLPRNPTKEQIRRAYRLLALQYHPDRPGGDEERFKDLTLAYQQAMAKASRAQRRVFPPSNPYVRTQKRTDTESRADKTEWNFWIPKPATGTVQQPHAPSLRAKQSQKVELEAPPIVETPSTTRTQTAFEEPFEGGGSAGDSKVREKTKSTHARPRATRFRSSPSVPMDLSAEFRAWRSRLSDKHGPAAPARDLNVDGVSGRRVRMKTHIQPDKHKSGFGAWIRTNWSKLTDKSRAGTKHAHGDKISSDFQDAGTVSAAQFGHNPISNEPHRHTHPFVSPDLTVRLKLDVRSTFRGGVFQIAYYRVMACGSCGTTESSQCACLGLGLVKTRHTLKVKVPSGAISGSRMHITGQGNQLTPGQEPGDLFLVLEPEPMEGFQLKGLDLIGDFQVTGKIAATGGTAFIALPRGRVAVHVPPRTQQGDRFSLRGEGLPEWGGERIGDAILSVVIK